MVILAPLQAGPKDYARAIDSVIELHTPASASSLLYGQRVLHHMLTESSLQAEIQYTLTVGAQVLLASKAAFDCTVLSVGTDQ